MKFNTITLFVRKTRNHEGAKAYKLTPELELYTAAATSMLADKFYESTDARIERLRTLIAASDPVFVAKLAVYVREKMYLRSMPIVLAVELAKVQSGNSLVSRTVNRVVQRADEITEVLAFYQLANQRAGLKQLNRLSKQVQKGLAQAFNKFDEYQFAKYDRDGAAIKLRDALFLVHPKAKNEAQQAIFDRIAAKTLATAQTWETALSQAGQTADRSDDDALQTAKSEAWEDLILSGKLGYMALLRNLRNILQAGVSQEALARAAALIGDKRAVLRSKQLPFRFLSAYRELSGLTANGTTIMLDAIEQAVVHAAENIAGFGPETRVVIAADVSSSMYETVSPKSVIQNFDIGLMLASLMRARSKNAITGIFGDTWKIIQVPSTGILANVEAFRKREGEVGYSTNGYKVIDDLISRKVQANKVMIFTDCQMWDSHANTASISASWAKYRREVAPNAKLYLFDLAGYGATPLDVVADNSVHLIAGWSDKIFDVLAAIETGSDALAEIKAIEI